MSNVVNLREPEEIQRLRDTITLARFADGFKVDNTGDSTDNAGMSTPVTTDLLDAKLETIETKMDARVQRIEEKMDAFVEANKETQASIKSLKATIIITAISTVLAIVLGVAAFNATVLSNMVASFESGKNTAQSLGQTQQELQKREQRLDAIDSKLDQLIAAPAKK